MKLLVGLGNPGRTHLLNRHNLGFLAVDAFVALKGEEFRKEEFRSITARFKVGGEDVLVMKPETFMNRSGDAVSEAMQFFKVPITDVIVAHDELDIPPCSFRLKRGGGHGGHNGLRSLMTFGDDFIRIRMGVGRPPHPGMDTADFVLGNLTVQDLEFWENEMENVAEAIEMCVTGQFEKAMNRFNRKPEQKG